MQTRRTDATESAEQANLCMEDRVSTSRQARYEDAVGSPRDWRAWRARHERYVESEVRRPPLLSAAFGHGEPSLLGMPPNEYLYRIERIDSLLSKYGVGAERVNEWISDRGAARSSDPSHALEELTQQFNRLRRDDRPMFVVLEAEFPGLAQSADWADQMCNRCGLAHLFTGGLVTLALFRYQVQDVLNESSWPGTVLFASPTVMDQPMSDIYFPAPRAAHGGHSVGLQPLTNCSHLATELIHARMDYQAHHWVSVDTVKKPCVRPNDIRNLRIDHLNCIRQDPRNTNYGRGCV